jgi:hypothetical protein
MDILTDIRLYTKSFKKDEKNKAYFEKISENKLEKLFFILQDNMKGYTLKESLQRAKKYDAKKSEPTNTSVAEDLDLTEHSNAEKSDMDEYKNAITKFKYDESESKNEEVAAESIKFKEENEDDDDDDFHDTDEEEEEEEERNPPSVSTIEEVKKKKHLFETIINSSASSSQAVEKSEIKVEKQEEVISKSTALDLLSTQLSSVKARIYDFEDDVDDEEAVDARSRNEDEVEDNENEKIETAKVDNDDFDDDSF